MIQGFRPNWMRSRAYSVGASLSEEKNMERPKANRKKVLIAVAWVAGLGGAGFVLFHFFAIPQTCSCRATVSPDLSDAFIVDNSIGDSRSILIAVSSTGGGILSICYSEREPKHGHVTRGNPGSHRQRGCKSEFEYGLGDRNQLRKSDIESIFDYRLTEILNYDGKRGKSTRGALYLNRSTNSCGFELKEWNKKFLTGQLECDYHILSLPLFWPQDNELFYTRVFYAIHKVPAGAKPVLSNPVDR
jgi:hypothetical protein